MCSRLMTWGLLVLLAGSTTAQTAPLPDPATLLGHSPWPGMAAWDAVWCRDLVFRAQFVELRELGQPSRVVWVKDVRARLKANGFYGLTINGNEVDEGTVWLLYEGRMTNLRVLFSYGSDPVKDVSPFRD